MKSFLFLIIFLLFSVFDMNSQTVMSLEECIQLAQENSISVKQSYLTNSDAIVLEKYARQQLLPSLNSSTDVSYNLGRSIDPTTNDFLTESFTSQRYSINSMLTLYNGGKLRNSIKQAMMNRKATEKDIEQMKRDVALLVANTYLSILYAKENLANAQNQYNATKEQLEKMHKLIKSGLQAPTAALNLEAQLLSDEQVIISRKNDLEKFYLDLKNILLLDDSVNLQIEIPVIDVDKLSMPELKTVNELYNASLQHYPAFAAAEYRIKSAEYQNKIAAAALLPSVNFYAGLSTNYANRAKKLIGTNQVVNDQTVIFNGQEVTIGFPVTVPVFGDYKYFDQLRDNAGVGLALQISVPIYNRYAVRSQIQRTKLNIESAKLSREKIVQNVKSNIQVSFADAKSSRLQYFAASKAYEAQKAAFENAKKQFDIGALGTYDYLNAKSMFEQSVNTLLISKYTYLFKTKILEFYLGENLSFKN